MSDLKLKQLLGREYYEELKTQQLFNKVRKGDYMPPLYDWLKEVNPEYNWDWPFQSYAIKKLQAFTDGKIKKLMVFAPPRQGKRIADSTPVLTPEGWKTHGELKVGDYVYHPSGKPVEVLATSDKGICDIALTFSTKETILAHKDHLWTIISDGYRKEKTVTTEYLNSVHLQNGTIGKRGNKYRFQVRNNSVIEFEEKDLLIHPYVLGVWLGDGSSSIPRITHAPTDTEHIDEMIRLGHPVSSRSTHKTTGVISSHFYASTLKQDLRSMGLLNNKHVPDDYKFSSEEQRLELLAGMIDTDGSVDKDSRVHISNTNKGMIDAFEEIVRSFGWSCCVTKADPVLSTSGIQGKKVCYSLSFYPDRDIPTRIPRKKINRYLTVRRKRSIRKVEEVELGELGHCIQVDSPDGLYLVGKTLIPTHNSQLISVHYPAYLLERNPTDRVILATYNQTLANKMSRAVRSLARTRLPLDPERAAMEEWDTKEGGGLRAVGVGAGVTGVGGNCLVGSSLISTESGQMRIRDFFSQREVPKVLSYNIQSRELEYKNVVAGKISQTSTLYTIKTDCTIVQATEDHLFYTGKEYVCAKDLKEGDRILNETFHLEPILSVEKTERTELVYDLQVEDNHNFFAEGLLTHNCIIIDDPVRSRKDASSPTIRRTTWEWYQDDLRTRLEPNGRIAILMTRWHEQDLCGMLLEHEPELWDVVRLPALAEENDPLGRKVGESINPERFSREALLEIKKTMGRSFYALYQQRPQEQEGEFFKASWFKKLDELPPLEQGEKYEFVRFWDKAATTEDRSDYTVGVLMCKNRKTGMYYIVDVVRGRWMPHTRDSMILRTAQKDQELYGHVRIFHEEEPGSSGKDAAKQTNQLLSGYSVKAIKSTGNKQLRSEPYQSQCEAGHVSIIKGQWNADFIDEHATFPLGGHDDIVDASGGAFSQLTKGKGFISIGDRFR